MALGLAVAVVVALLVAGVFSGSDKKSQTTAQTTPATQTQTTPSVAMPAPPTTNTQPSSPSSGGGYPAGFRQKFVDSCASGGAPRNICGCTYDKLKSRYTFPQFVSLLGKVHGSSLPGPVRDAVQQCARG
jgi:hypothetical protein